MKQLFFLLVAMFALVQPQQAQPGLPVRPLSMRKAMPNIQNVSQLQSCSQLSEAVSAASADDFAIPFSTDFNPCNSGEWSRTDNQQVWRIAIASHNACSMNLILSGFNIPCGADLYIYGADAQKIQHYTSDDNAPFLPTPPVAGDVVFVEYNEPDTAAFQGFFEIVQVAHGFRNVLLRQHADIQSDCHINADSELVAEWSDERRAVCKILIGGTTFCTGVLLNTTDGSFLPYVLTARHCINTEKQALNSIFYFNYESSNSIDTQYIVGASLVALKDNDEGFLDFALLKLNNSIPDDFNAYYAGWDCSGAQPVGAVCIHHPDGDVKKISVDKDTLRSASYRIFDADSFWNVEEWESGATEVGSSGAPLFNDAHRVVGILSGGDSQCGYPMNDYFQKFSVCYNSYNDDSMQLAHWLNPAGANVQAIDGSYSLKSGVASKTMVANCAVYPNPVHSQLFLTSENEPVEKVEICSLDGVVVLRKMNVEQTDCAVDVSALPHGVYVCRIGFTGGNDCKCLIVKE